MDKNGKPVSRQNISNLFPYFLLKQFLCLLTARRSFTRDYSILLLMLGDEAFTAIKQPNGYTQPILAIKNDLQNGCVN